MSDQVGRSRFLQDRALCACVTYRARQSAQSCHFRRQYGEPVLVAVATFAGAAMQSATGFGFALVLSPALFATLDPAEAVSALLVLGLPLGLLVLADTRLDAVRWREIGPALLAAIPGLGLGAGVLAPASKPLLQVVVGVTVLAAVVWQARRRSLEAGAEAPRRAAVGPRAGVAAGLASGALTTSISLSGPPLVLWLEAVGV